MAALQADPEAFIASLLAVLAASLVVASWVAFQAATNTSLTALVAVDTSFAKAITGTSSIVEVVASSWAIIADTLAGVRAGAGPNLFQFEHHLDATLLHLD